MHSGVTGFVKNEKMRPVIDAVIEVRDAENNMLTRTTVSRNEAVFKFSLPAGKYFIVAQHPSYAHEPVQVEVESRNIKNVDLYLRTAAGVRQAPVSFRGMKLFTLKTQNEVHSRISQRFTSSSFQDS